MDQFLVEMLSLARIYLCGGWPGRGAAKWLPLPEQQYRNALIKLLLEDARRNQVINKRRPGWIVRPVESGFGAIPGLFARGGEAARDETCGNSADDCEETTDHDTGCGLSDQLDWSCWQNQRPCGLKVSLENK